MRPTVNDVAGCGEQNSPNWLVFDYKFKLIYVHHLNKNKG